jgi:hypothetical protein
MSLDTVDEEGERLADLFAAHGASALERAREVSELNTASESCKVTGYAIGIVMERHELNEGRALAFLARASSDGERDDPGPLPSTRGRATTLLTRVLALLRSGNVQGSSSGSESAVAA